MSAEYIPDLLRRHASVRANVPALVSGEKTGLSYGDWWRQSSDVALALVESGVASGDRVAIVGGNACYEHVGVAYIGAMLAGAAVLPLASSHPPVELAEAIATAAVKLVVLCDQAVAPAWDCPTVEVARLAATPDTSARLPVLSGDAAAELLSTSGTTGLPRLVEASHANISRDFDHEPLTDDEPRHLVHALPIGTNIGQVAFRSSLTLGHTVVALDTPDPRRYARIAAELPMREALFVPAMAAHIAADGIQRGWTLPAVEQVVVSGASTPPMTWRRLAAIFPNARFISSYTTTEAWPARVVTEVDPAKPDSAGRPLDDQAVEIRDDAGLRLPPLETGTIYLGHRGTRPRRYANDTELPASEEWIETDDLGYLDEDGHLFITDRKSDVIRSGSHTVSTLEVEHVLAQHPQVVEAAVVGLPHPVLGSYVAACVTASGTLDVDELVQLARATLAPHKVPRVVYRRSSLPRSATGKVAKHILRQELAGSTSAAGRQPIGGDEARIQAIWEQVLEQPAPDVDRSFFSLGGDSVAALRVVVGIQDHILPEVPVEDLLAASTIRAQAQVLAATRKRLPPPVGS